MTDTWPGWKNEGLIGEGSFGKVYRISREEFGTTYEAALKVITIPQSKGDIEAAYDEGLDKESVTEYFRSFVEDIVAEFALMSRMKGNSHIVSYEDHMVVQHEDGVGWDILIRMELLRSLNEYMRERPLQEADVIRLGSHIAQALETCESKGILHRDIKPENIFVSEEGNFKLGDFGVARAAEKTISVMSRKGTYTYMAPEVYSGEKYGYAADLYSLGIVLYRFLNDNRTPFLPPYPKEIRYSDREEALNRRVSGQLPPEPAHGSEALRGVVMKLIAFQPEDRYSSAQELVRALAGLEAGQEAAREPDGGAATFPERTARPDEGRPEERGGIPTSPADDYEEKTVSALAVTTPTPREPVANPAESVAKKRPGVWDWVLFGTGVVLALIWYWVVVGLIAGPVCLVIFYVRCYKLKVLDWVLVIGGILALLLTSGFPYLLLAGGGCLAGACLHASARDR